MDDFIAHTSRRRTALAVGPMLGFLAIGMWMVGVFGPVPVSRRAGPLMTEFVGWCSILFFGTGAVVLAKLWWKNEERLRINRSGIRIAEWSDQTIPWDEIYDVTEWRNHEAEFIVLHLRDPSRFRGKGLAVLPGRLNRTSTGGDVAISLYGTDREFDEAMEAIATYRTGR